MDQILKKVKLLKIPIQKDLTTLSTLDNQIGDGLVNYFEGIGLGWCNGDQESQLEKNKLHLKNSLCFVFRHWRKLFNAEHPLVPAGEYASLDGEGLLTAVKQVQHS